MTLTFAAALVAVGYAFVAGALHVLIAGKDSAFVNTWFSESPDTRKSECFMWPFVVVVMAVYYTLAAPFLAPSWIVKAVTKHRQSRQLARARVVGRG